MFAIGDSLVRPRVQNRFRPGEKLGLYLQVYNLTKPEGSVHYEVRNASSNERVLDFSEDLSTLRSSSEAQLTIEKMLPLSSFAPGAYSLTVSVSDRNTGQVVSKAAGFTVTAE
jgi:hypothetical protein